MNPAAGPHPKRVSRLLIIGVCIFALLGVVARVGIAAAVLIRDYSFFEATVISLLILILSSVALAHADAEVEKLESKKKTSPEKDWMVALVAGAKELAYSLIFLMAVVKLVFALLQ